MAVTASGVFYPALRDALTGVGSINWDTNAGQIALFTNLVTPDFGADVAYGTPPYDNNEVTDSNSVYLPGGSPLTGTVLTNPPGIFKYTADDVLWSNSSITNARCALFYVNVSTLKQALFLVDFGSDYSTSSGPFEIQWNVGGILTIQLSG